VQGQINHTILAGHISETECNETVSNMKNNKSPGSDGISVELYKLFWKKYKTSLYKCNKLLIIIQLPLQQNYKIKV